MNYTETLEALNRKLPDLHVKDIRSVIEAYIQLINDNAFEGRETVMRELGRFVPVTSAERKARNPGTGEAVVVPPRKTLKFKAAPTFKKRLAAS